MEKDVLVVVAGCMVVGDVLVSKLTRETTVNSRGTVVSNHRNDGEGFSGFFVCFFFYAEHGQFGSKSQMIHANARERR